MKKIKIIVRNLFIYLTLCFSVFPEEYKDLGKGGKAIVSVFEDIFGLIESVFEIFIVYILSPNTIQSFIPGLKEIMSTFQYIGGMIAIVIMFQQIMMTAYEKELEVKIEDIIGPVMKFGLASTLIFSAPYLVESINLAFSNVVSLTVNNSFVNIEFVKALLNGKNIMAQIILGVGLVVPIGFILVFFVSLMKELFLRSVKIAIYGIQFPIYLGFYGTKGNRLSEFLLGYFHVLMEVIPIYIIVSMVAYLPQQFTDHALTNLNFTQLRSNYANGVFEVIITGIIHILFYILGYVMLKSGQLQAIFKSAKDRFL